MSEIYRFHVEGHLDHTWSIWLGDVLIQHQPDGTTVFTKTIPDQAALYGVLFKLENTGVALIAVERTTSIRERSRSTDTLAGKRRVTQTAANVAVAQQETTMTYDSMAEEQAIRETIAAVEAGWNAGDGSRFGAPFAEDADYVIVDGRYIKGRSTIAQGHQQIFDTIYRGSHNAATVRQIRLLGDDVAVAHVEWSLTLKQDTATHTSMCTMVMARNNGTWSIAAYHNTPVVSR
jgi:uncharacterized protein (TIGR02246 family)